MFGCRIENGEMVKIILDADVFMPHEIDWIPVKSSNMQAYAYDQSEKVAYVRFINGSEGRYTGVPRSKWLAWQRAESKGGYLNAHIKPVHPWVAGTVNTPKTAQERPQVASNKPKGHPTTPGPVQTALTAAKQQMGKQTHRVLYFLWAASGKPESASRKDVPVDPGSKPTAAAIQQMCLSLLAEVGQPKNMIDGKNIDAAIKLAKERGL